jgi:WD40 repeat protein
MNQANLRSNVGIPLHWTRRRRLAARLSIAVLLVLGLAFGWYRTSAGPEWPESSVDWTQHANLVQAGKRIAWRPDSRTLATTSATFWREAVILWDAETGAALRTLPEHSGPVILAWSPDGASLAAASRDGSAVLWDADVPRTRVVFSAGSEILASAWSPDGQCFATGSGDGSAAVWDVATGERLARLTGHSGRVVTLAWSPDSSKLATGSEDATVRVWRKSNWDLWADLRGHEREVYGLAWSPDGMTLATSGLDGRVLFWPSDRGMPRPKLTRHRSPVVQLAWSPRGDILASSSTDPSGFWRGFVPDFLLGPRAEAILWGRNAVPRAILAGHPHSINCVAWSPDGSTLATASYPGLIILWNALDGVPLGSLRGPREVVEALAWSPDGRMLAASYFHAGVTIWKHAEG